MSANLHVFVVFCGPYTGQQKAAQHMLFQGFPFLGVCAFRHTRLQLEVKLGGMEIGSDGFIRPMRCIDLLLGVAVLWGTLGRVQGESGVSFHSSVAVLSLTTTCLCEPSLHQAVLNNLLKHPSPSQKCSGG